MRSFLKTFIGILIALTAIGAAAFAFFIFLATKSHPKTEGKIGIKGASDTVAIYRNDYGIPHIVAKSDADVFFGIGYAHAQDRFWQMDISRRAGRGRLSEAFGRRTLQYDMFLRCVGIGATADKLYKNISEDSRLALDAYARGVNAFLDDNMTKLPFEFDALGYKPERWSASDCLVVARMMAWEMNISFWTDPVFGEIADKIGYEKARELVPSYPDDAPFVVEQASAGGDSSASAEPLSSAVFPQKSGEFLSAPNLAHSSGLGNSLREMMTIALETREFLKSEGSAVGSNSWVIHKKKNSASGVILANDPHLTLSSPPRWYEAHLTSPTLNAIGMTLPGLPFVVSGRNDNIAWGITNMMLDDCDFFIEKIDTANKKRYILPDGSSKKFRIDRDTIKVCDSSDAIIDFRYTDRSAVISDVHPFNYPDKTLNDKSGTTQNSFLQRYALTFQWTGQNMSDEILAFYRINKAKNWEQFLRGANGFAVPALNFTYADKSGNMGIAPSGSVPSRLKCNPNFPNPAWDKEYLWQTPIPASALPRTYNPQRGYVLSANNKTARNYPHFLSSLWEPASRAIRINELLANYQQYSVQEAGIMQIDVVSPHARGILAKVLPTLDSAKSSMSGEEYSAFEILKNWDFSMEANESAPAVYTAFFERFVYNTFADELGETLYREYTFVENIPTRKIAELLKDSSNHWFDDVRTQWHESRRDVILKSFKDGIALLQERLGSKNPGDWKYGDLHQLTIPHFLGAAKPLDKLVNLGPYRIGGDNTTVNNAEWKFHSPYKPVLGASMRIVNDMEDSVVYAILPGGNSGQPLSRDYANQVQLWLNGGLIQLPVSRKPHESFSKKLELVPKK